MTEPRRHRDRRRRIPVRGLACLVLTTFLPIFAADARATETSAGPDDWKAEANARIEAIRKRDVQILVVDRVGAPVPAAEVVSDQLRHRFAFGSCINTNARSNPQYADFFKSHFEWAVFENESKWFYNEPERDFETYADADWLYGFCEQNGIRVRGHNIFWAKEEYTPPWCRSLPDQELRQEVDERLDSAVPHFAGKFLHWDVNNEMLDGDFFRRRLGPDIEPYMFQRAHELDPAARLFVNDYYLMGGSASRVQAYIDQVRSLEARGATVHAVGDQGHFWGDVVDPANILATLDQLSVLNKPVWVTEYDAVDVDENSRADKLENLYRAAFSHPIVEGILMWGFWGGSHWRGPDAAIVDLDWRVNAAGLRYEALLAEWTTHAAGVTDALGSYGYRGFQGTYEIAVRAGSTSPPATTIEVAPGDGVARYLIPLKPGSCFAAEEIQDLRLSHDRSTGITTLGWRPLPWRADMAGVYDTLRSDEPASFAAASCVESNDGADAVAIDAAAPTPGGVFYYLIRGEYDCSRGAGPLGSRSDGTPRSGPACA